MKGLILCAGYGTRLRPLTLTKPKCMVSVAGKTVLERLVEQFQAVGINEIVVNVHWLYPQIMEYFGPKLLYFYESSLLGEAKTEECLKPWLGNEYVVANGDTLNNFDLKGMIDHCCDNQTLYKMQGEVYAGLKVVKGSGVVQEKDQVKLNEWWVDMGTHEGLSKIRAKYEN